MSELTALQDRLTQAKQEEATYQVKLDRIIHLENEINEREAEVQQYDERQQFLEKQLAHYQTIEEYYTTTQKLQRINQPMQFPADGLARYQELYEKWLPLKSETNVLTAKRIELEKNMNDKRANGVSEESFQLLKEAMSLTETIASYDQELQQLEEKMDAWKQELTRKLDEMQLSLSLSDFWHLTLPFHLEEVWTDLAKQSEQLQWEKQYVMNDLKSTQQMLDDLHEQERALRQRLIDANVMERYQEEVEQTVHNRKQEVINNQYQVWRNQLKKYVTWSTIGAFVGIGIASVLLIVSDIALGAVIAGFSLIQNLGFRLALQSLKGSDITHQSLTDAELDERKQLIREQQNLNDQLSQIQKDQKHYQMEQLKLNEKRSFLDERWQQLEAKRKDQLATYPFLETIEINYWYKVYQQLSSLKQQQQAEWNQLREQYETYQTERQFYCNQRSEKTSELSLRDDIETAFKAESARRDELQQMHKQWEQVKQEERESIEKQKPYEEEFQALFEEARVDNKTDFLEKGEQYNEWKSFVSRRDQLYDQLNVWLDEEELRNIETGLYEDDVALRKQVETVKHNRKEMEQTLKQTRQQLSDEKASVQVLEAKEDVSILKHEYAQKQEKLQQLAKEWAMDQIAFAKLSQAKHEFYQQYMPWVFQQASHDLKQLTLGTYEKIILTEDAWIQLVDKDGFAFTIEELSQGAKDQVYIALRFALSKLMTEKLAFPFMIDDGFVHFDPQRKQAVFRLLQELSHDHQILYFTAHTTSDFHVTLLDEVVE
ncbi:hypothetical protein [Gracilibacillus halophilus]|uniref:hypothetical protein n=1 Tax=Gracilibacillus halophilus TaxID=470864 RepID=UPI00039BD6C3|nr:hypothetical protein [Gracilibacillus halophilus]